jgi:hypothetical protein
MKVITFLLMIAFSILVLAIGMPPFEPSSQEARLIQAYMQVQEIKAGSLPVDTVDPWKARFRNSQDDHCQIVRVVSFGPNGSTGADGFDEDDIVSEMASPPHQAMIRNRQFRLLATLIFSASPWLVLSVMLILPMVMPARPNVSDNTPSPAIESTA